TVVRSNPAQDRVLRLRPSVLQVVAGPPGTGKTQTIINLIASAVCDGQTVLFISKNNTAVDNVYEAFTGQELFPGILRLGNRDFRERTVAYMKQVLAGLEKGLPLPGDRAAFQAEGAALIRQIARLEEERAEVERLQATVDEMALLLRRTDEQLQSSGLYRYATDLAAQITEANAHQFQPIQVVGLRRLAALTANWQQPPASLWTRLLARVGLLDRLRLRVLEQGQSLLRLPPFCRLGGKSLSQRLDDLLRLDAAYPFLLATARDLLARAALAAKRSPEAIRHDLDQAYAAKLAHDRRHLSRRWAELVNGAQPRAAQLQQLGALFERMANGTADTDTRRQFWRRYGELLTIFPVICSTNLSLAGTAPNEPERFDLVILDEASQSDIASFLPALYRARRACVVGDDRQLSHISNLGDEADAQLMATANIQQSDRLSYHRHSAFDRAMKVAGQSAFTLLDRHYRCVPEIIGFCNEHFYGGKLKLERTSEPALPLTGGLPAQGFLLDEVAGATEYRATAASRSGQNAREAERVMHLARQYIAAGLTDIGIVTPFRAQRELLDRLRRQTLETEADGATRKLIEQVEIGTIHTFQGGQHKLMLFSMVIAPGAREGTIRWFEENQNLLNVAISRARDLLIVVGHRDTLARAGGILASMVAYADRLAQASGALPPLPPGLQPERLGLRQGEEEILRSWLSPPGAVAEVLNPGEQALYRELAERLKGRPVMVAPKMRVLDSLEPTRLADLTQQERDYAFRAHFDLVVVGLDGFRPVAAVELDGATHEQDPLTMARDRLKNAICEKASLPLLRVRWGDFGALAVLDGIGPH
ncbi:MAG: AAA domain-containing protein, partial [Bacillota bacterium]